MVNEKAIEYKAIPKTTVAKRFKTPKVRCPRVVSRENDSYIRVEKVVNPPTKPTHRTATYTPGKDLIAPSPSMTPSAVAPSMLTAKVPNGKKLSV